MRNRTSLVVLLASVVALGTQLVPAAGSAAPGPDRRTATQRLYGDADGALRVSRQADGRARFVGVPAGSRVDNPGVTAATGSRDAARSHLERYGAVLGVDVADLSGGTVTRSVTGHDLVRYQQRVGGVPVLGGQVVVDLRPDRELASIVATPTRSTAAPAARVTASRAAAVARAAVAKRLPGQAFRIVRQGRWVFDPTVFGAPRGPGARTVWRFEATNGTDLRRQVLVDDQSGHIALDIDLINTIDRVVCDNANVPRGSNLPCTSGFARTEASGPSGVADVNDAFVLGGAVSTYYNDIAGLDLTQALGIDVGGVKKLAQTVRWCYTGVSCPYANAFWNGSQMYYGATYASADDVVGHEMTHGVIDQNSELFYWFQSGAINESIADIMGEIVDHRNTLVGGDATWLLGEDLPIGAIRNMSNPAAFGDPDRMTSANYTRDLGWGDNGGVHTNSGVGNKTAFLISQGGSFNGQTIVGIDGADTGLTKTGKLYYSVIQGLTSGSDYAVLADVLEQSCQNLVGTSGFTSADCDNIHKVTLATELRTTPTNAAQPNEAPASCPATTVKRVLFDSETGTPGSKFTKPSTWIRSPGTVTEPVTGEVWTIDPNATSGRTSWFGNDSATTRVDALKLATALKLPAAQKSFMWFAHWRLFEFNSATSTYFDGGTVDIDNTGDAAGAQNAQSLPWVNGPKQTLAGTSRKAFGGDSLGYTSSRVDLSTYAGKNVKPQFTIRTDNTGAYIGWYLDDIRIYTCDPTVITGKTPTISGTLKVGKTLTAKPGAWSPSGLTFAYQWFRGSTKINGATSKTYTLKSGDKGKHMKVKVTGSKTGFDPVSKTSQPTGTVQ